LAFAALALVVLLCLWLGLGTAAWRRRAYRRAKRLLRQGRWEEALALALQQQNRGMLNAFWQDRFGKLAGQAHQLAADKTLEAEHYEEALEHCRSAARLLGQDEAVPVGRLFEQMLARVRQLFSLNTPPDTESAQGLIARILALQADCAEALFWQGLCHVRQGAPDPAQASLRAACEKTHNTFVDPPLYLGMLLSHLGLANQALPYLSEADRRAPASPLVSWQLGAAVLAADGDSSQAVDALQHAVDKFLAMRGTSAAAVANHQPVWLDGLPESHSYIRRLAARHPYACPILGSNVSTMTRQARLALAQAQLRLGHCADAVHLYTRLLEESPPTVPVLRGLGQALARLERYEDAYKHLRIAYDTESPANPMTAGYLALCAARGKPAQAPDKARNILWAVSLLSQFDLAGNAEWAALSNAIHAEARALGLVVAAEDQRRLCDALASVRATDAEAAAAYEQLLATVPDALRAEHAWLYCRAAQQQNLRGLRELDLFARAFSDAAGGRAYYAENHWNFDDLEYAYLERQAGRRPGSFPEVLGSDYQTRGEGLLLARSQAAEKAGREDQALAIARILYKLAPRSASAIDRLAQLCYRRGDLDQAAALLGELHTLRPGDPIPLMRRAVVEQQRGDPAGYTEAIKQALERSAPKDRAAVAFLGARLALGHDLNQARVWLEQCLREEPSHKDARWCLAAVYSLLGDRAQAARREHDGERPGQQ
jgi:Flp pilus assembly protein TadD